MAKKITSYFLSVIVSVSLLAGYFCFGILIHPIPTVRAMAMPVTTDMSNCHGITQTDHFMLASVDSNAVAPCCLEKNNNNSQSGAIIVNNFSPDNAICQFISAAPTDNYNPINQTGLFDYPISPTQTDFLTSVILIE